MGMGNESLGSAASPLMSTCTMLIWHKRASSDCTPTSSKLNARNSGSAKKGKSISLDKRLE